MSPKVTDWICYGGVTILVAWGFWHDSRKPQIIGVHHRVELGGTVYADYWTSNRFYSTVVMSNGPAITTDYGVWGVELYRGQLLWMTNVRY